MRETPGLTELFPTLRPSHRGRMPNAYEMEIEWERRKHELIAAARFGEMFSYTHRQTRADSDGIERCAHATRVGKYGSAVLGCRQAECNNDRFVITSGGNFKLLSGNGEYRQYHPTEGWKMCSEPEAVTQAIQFPWRCRTIYGLALFSNNMQPEDVSGVYCNIQQPCSDCRAFLSAYLEPSSPIMLMRMRLPCDPFPAPSPQVPVTEYIDDLIVEHWTFGQILANHNYVVGRRT